MNWSCFQVQVWHEELLNLVQLKKTDEAVSVACQWPLSWAAPSVVTFILQPLHDLVMHLHTLSHASTHSHTGCPGVRQQNSFNLFSSALIGSKLPSLPSWCANQCGIEGRPPITPQAHLQDTSGCRAAVCDLYMADEGEAGGCKVFSSDLDQRDSS